ncbi:Zinc finger, CCCH-type domain-containing protein [Strongyloides ratti]|uniref:Zinc finger, CCCH-type domain-containing protein n=1 Tax=Strongyloides ratti TaxID=34506 RepID=A0A090L2K0_STRRB|nr:Zinc finger, CCCH-type domain-containing protein [Strongyloides ratti]CEF64046.1 Zinc finger, CCCH-type domain-containing protein [Strongyloides ratti]
METTSGEFIPTVPGCPENCIECGRSPLYTDGNRKHSELGSCCSSFGVVNDEFGNMIRQRHGFTSSTKQMYSGRMMSGNPLGYGSSVNFGYSYNPQSFTDSMNSYNYDRPYPPQRHNHSQYFDSSTGSYRVRGSRKRKPMGHYQDSTFGHSFSGSGLSSNCFLDKSSTWSNIYGSSNDSGSTRSNTCSCYSLQSNSSRLPLSKDGRIFQLGICPSFLFTNHCIFFPNCFFSHSRSDYEDKSLSTSEGCLLQDLTIPTEECKHFSVSGKCPIGLCCNFIHKMPQCEPQLQNDQTTIAPADDMSTTTPDEDIFHEFFMDNNDDDINQCCDIDKVYIDDKF